MERSTFMVDRRGRFRLIGVGVEPNLETTASNIVRLDASACSNASRGSEIIACAYSRNARELSTPTIRAGSACLMIACVRAGSVADVEPCRSVSNV
jgi:hypothetical protein